jgi:hypothetical protein
MPQMGREGADQSHHLASKDEHGCTALHRATGTGAVEAVNNLLERGADPCVLDSPTDHTIFNHPSDGNTYCWGREHRSRPGCSYFYNEYI